MTVEHSRSMLFSLHAIYMDSDIRLSKDMRESMFRMALYHACIAYERNVKRGREVYKRTKRYRSGGVLQQKG